MISIPAPGLGCAQKQLVIGRSTQAITTVAIACVDLPITNWTGYKVHLTETCSENLPHVITQVETTPATTQVAKSRSSPFYRFAYSLSK